YERGLPRPRRPGHADDERASRVRKQRGEERRRLGAAVLDERDRAGEGPDVSRAHAGLEIAAQPPPPLAPDARSAVAPMLDLRPPAHKVEVSCVEARRSLPPSRSSRSRGSPPPLRGPRTTRRSATRARS